MVTQLGHNGIPRGDDHVSQAKTMHKKTPDNRRLKWYIPEKRLLTRGLFDSFLMAFYDSFLQ
ncbi:hypothetical protein MOY_01000 [Halomonas sp. GFAJ-1]|nr:hypothetical protein BB497_12290 [Halomonas sp. GFAJ-1]EHK62587.1 hypothetical protein MOY_01000 [Halomonas sp. GFAJ-1]